MAALQVKQIWVYLELADLPKIVNTKLDEGEEIYLFVIGIIYL